MVISHETLFKLSKWRGGWGVGKMVWKWEGEKIHSVTSNCSTIQQKHGRCQPGGHVIIIISNTEQDKALLPKIFWHLIDMAKINAWILYRCHFRQNIKPHKDQKSLLQFSVKLSDALIFANKVNPSSSRGRPPKRSLDAPTTGKKPTHRCSF